MFEEIKNNKWIVLLIIMIFAVLEVQIFFLSNQTKSVARNSFASSKPASEVIPPAHVAAGRVKKIEGSDIILSVERFGDIRVKTTPGTKIQQRTAKSADSEPSSKELAEAAFSDIGIGDSILVSSREVIKEKAASINADTIYIFSKNQL